jgi:hypothetical protein
MNYQYVGEELELFSKAKNWKSYFSRFLIPYIKGNVLEVGAGLGETTPYLYISKVSQWTCLEPDERFYQMLNLSIKEGRLPGNCLARQGTISSLSTNETFDTIIYIDVLEHIEHDHEELKNAMKHLNNNGIIIVLSPAFQSLYNQFDKAIGHYRRYTKSSLRLTAKLPELKEKKILYLESAGIFLLLMNKLLARRKYPTQRQVVLWDKVIVPVSRVTDKLINYSFGKTIIGVWQYQP